MRGEPVYAVPKPRPAMLERDERTAKERAFDERESRKARKRAHGRCEVTVNGARCRKRDCETHHHIGGWKLRGRGASALAENKTRCCTDCHSEITGNVLEHIEGNRYRRAR